ncbi:hypothetical protein PspLS_11511 [Pyricularia sp. CBS 133598]|nr:hypothetical protein PspLS_11511 [Pyricularia sp. CBS 133598]
MQSYSLAGSLKAGCKATASHATVMVFTATAGTEMGRAEAILASNANCFACLGLAGLKLMAGGFGSQCRGSKRGHNDKIADESGELHVDDWYLRR